MSSLKRYFVFLLLLGFVAGCGSTEEIYVSNNSPIPVALGQVRVNTTLESVAAQAETTSVGVVPSEVTDFRFSGYDANGNLLFAVIRPKAASVLLTNVPVQVTNLRIELLVGGLAVGGVSVPVTVNTSEITVVNNPTFVFIDGSGTVSEAPVYGSFANPVFETAFDFPTALASVGVTRVGAGVYSVSTEGDYLVTYNLGVYGDLRFEVLDGENTVVNFITFDYDWVDDPGFSFVVSLDPENGREAFRLTTPSGTYENGYNNESGNFTVVRIGPSTGSTLPDNVVEDGGEGEGEGEGPPA